MRLTKQILAITLLFTYSTFTYGATPDNTSADIHTAAGWSDDQLPTAGNPGTVDKDCLIKVSTSSVTASDVVYTIEAGNTVTRGSTSGRIDFGGATDITINGTLDLFATEDGVSSSRWFGSTTFTINTGGLLKLKDTTTADTVIIMRGDQAAGGTGPHINVQGGTVDVRAIELEDVDSLITVAAGASIQLVQEFAGNLDGAINFPVNSTGVVDIAAHTDASTAQTYWTGLWDSGNLKYNGQTKTALGDVPFLTYFSINSTSYALQAVPGINNFTNGGGDNLITNAANWEAGVVPGYDDLGVIGSGDAALFPNNGTSDINSTNLRIDTGGSLKPASNPTGYDIQSSIIHINGGTFNTTDVASDNLRFREGSNDTIITIDSGSFVTDTFQLVGAAEFNINGGTLSSADTFQFDSATTNYGEFLTVGGGSVELTNEIDFSTLTDGDALINFTNASLGTIDIAAHTDTGTASTYWTALWDSDKLLYNGQSKTVIGGSPAFESYFSIDATTFALKVDESLTPAYGIQIFKEAGILSWAVELEVDIASYEIQQQDNDGNWQTVQTIEALGGTNTSYSVEISAGEYRLVVIDNSGYSQSFGATNYEHATCYLDLLQGWNLLSIPYYAAELDSLRAVTNKFWAWNGNSYETIINPGPRQGFWIYTAETHSIKISGEVGFDKSLPLKLGWNLTGPTQNVIIPDGLLIYTWNQTYESLLNTQQTLIQGTGYWIYSDEETIIQME